MTSHGTSLWCNWMCTVFTRDVWMSLWFIQFVLQKGHVVRTEFRCSNCQNIRTWASSRVFGAHYLINQKLVLTSANILLCRNMFIPVGLCMPLHVLECSHLSILTSVNLLGWVLWVIGTYDKVNYHISINDMGRVYIIHFTIFLVYFVNKYVECVEVCTEESMQHAVDQVKIGQTCSVEGEVLILISSH